MGIFIILCGIRFKMRVFIGIFFFLSMLMISLIMNLLVNIIKLELILKKRFVIIIRSVILVLLRNIYIKFLNGFLEIFLNCLVSCFIYLKVIFGWNFMYVRFVVMLVKSVNSR